MNSENHETRQLIVVENQQEDSLSPMDDEKAEIAENDWQRRHYETEAIREEIRNRVRHLRKGNGVIHPAKPKPTINDTGEKKVGIYARVSTKSTEQTSSIENQTLYYQKRVSEEPQWTLQEIFSDEGKSGTSTKHREAFKRMFLAAENKEIDLILCASVNRFARNMADCMTYIRQLKSSNPSHPVGVYFETENIYTLDPDSNQRLSIHAMLAEWESANKSARMILSYDQRIFTGQYPVSDLLGFRHTKDGDLLIEPEEAKTVRYIFLAYLNGYTCREIAETLTAKGRRTLKGRTEWNPSMVRNIMTNERRWGDLSARKTIVIDFVEHKSKRNEDERVSAYEEGHHVGIVSPQIARAAKMMGISSRNLQSAVPNISVITWGTLKGFVSINPQWSGIDHSTFLKVCTEVYTDEELAELEEEIKLCSTNRNESKDTIGYEVPPGIYFLTRTSASMTLSNHVISFSSSCHDKLNHCEFIEVLYHPIMQMMIVRPSTEDNPNSIRWERFDGSIVSQITANAFNKSIYANMRWKPDYRFRFRGVTKERGSVKFLVFVLDEPQIITGKKSKEESEEPCGVREVEYIPYRIDDQAQSSDYAFGYHRYPAEWEGIVGLDYSVKKRRNQLISSITYEDICEIGVSRENPIIGGVIPTRMELQAELSELLMSM